MIDLSTMFEKKNYFLFNFIFLGKNRRAEKNEAHSP